MTGVIIVTLLIVVGLGVAVHLLIIRPRLRLRREEHERDLARRRDEAREIAAALRAARDALLGAEYVATSEITAWRTAHTGALARAGNLTFARDLPEEEREAALALARQLAQPAATVAAHNARFVARRVAEEREAFDRVERYPLTVRQREAIVTAEDATLVVAGAGTGKTSVIVGKVDYLLRRGLARPEEILVVAFATKAREELRARLGRLEGASGVAVSTFHALGLRIVGEAEGRRPDVSPLATDDEALRRFLVEAVRDLLLDPLDHALLVAFFTRQLDEAPAGADAADGDDYIRAQRAAGLRDLTGTLLKSREEVRIANWLTLRGIAWAYERPYPVDTATPEHRQYRPDFYLPDHDLYLEHFGVDAAGDTRPGIDRAEYHAGMAWKRALHARHGTRLIETYSHFSRAEGGLEGGLERALRDAGVMPGQPDAAQVDALIAREGKPFRDFVELLAQFLHLFRGAGGDAAEASRRARTVRDGIFLKLFLKVHARYEAALAEGRAIDFDAMIGRAREHVQAGRFRSPYRCLIVDEFQDIAAARLGLLLDLRAQVPHARLFAVGDDWQAIYRFAGSDVGLMADLARHAGATARVDLDTTFRYGQELLDASAAFVGRNPRQLRKALRAHDGVQDVRPLCAVFREGERQAGVAAALETIRRDIAARQGGTPATVLLLGRYHFNAPEDVALMRRAWSGDKLDVAFLTAHAAKGREADYAVVLGLESGEYGFPSRVVDDPVTKMVLTAEEPFPHAEERRLFYVALTRARRRSYLVAPADNPSPFVAELLREGDLREHVETIGEVSARHRCPTCQGRTIRRTQGRYGAFWACANYPLCDGKLDTCDRCREGALVAGDSPRTPFRCAACGHAVERCPRCEQGRLVEREGRYGTFLACSRWDGGRGCPYTRNTNKGH